MSTTAARPTSPGARGRSGIGAGEMTGFRHAERGLWLAVARTAQELGSSVRRPSGAAPAGLPLRMLQWLTGSGFLPFRRDEEKSASWHVLRHRRFLAYFGGSLVSNLGTWLQNTAQMLLAYQLTHSPFAVGVVTSAQFAGFLLIGPWAATLAERLGSKRVLIGSQLVSAVIAAVLAGLELSGSLTESQLTVGALGIGIAFTFALPVQTAMVPSLVPEDDTKAAMAMNSVSYNAGRTLAPVLCVAVIAGIGAAGRSRSTRSRLSSSPSRSSPCARAPARPPGRLTTGSACVSPSGARGSCCCWPWSPPSPSPMTPSWCSGPRSRATSWPSRASRRLLPVRAGSRDRARGAGAHQAVDRAPGGVPPARAGRLGDRLQAGVDRLWSACYAAVAAGVAGLLTGAATQSLLLTTAGPGLATQVMALWAIACGGSKPLASLTDGWLASHIGVFHTGIALAAPAIVIALVELFLSAPGQKRLKDWIYTRNGAPVAGTVRSS